MALADLLKTMTEAVAAGDGAGVAQCFTADGIYDDVFYGAFHGREAIADMIENYFHRDGKNFIWDMHDVVNTDDIGYARWVFSYDSKLAGMEGRRALFEGVCILHLQDGLIREYHEIANSGTGLVMMGFAPGRLSKFFQRQAENLAKRNEAQHHLVH